MTPDEAFMITWVEKAKAIMRNGSGDVLGMAVEIAKKAQAEAYERAARAVCCFCNEPEKYHGAYRLYSDGGCVHDVIESGGARVRCNASTIHNLKREVKP